MDGSTASLIAIPIVVTLALAAWLLVVAYAAAHPRWKHGPAAAESRPADLAPAGRVAAGQVAAGQVAADADQDASPDKPARLAA
jgi:hypothetical protein